ncbi:MAG: ABC transporter permease [Candidatus Jordarchaeaceae archaeon]
MALRKERISFAFKRFKGFWNQFRRSKRGVFGLLILSIYIVIAIAAPYLSPIEPYAPKISGHYPAGVNPKIASTLALPEWYKTLLGQSDLSENLFPIKNHEMSTIEAITSQWNWTNLANIIINPTSNKGDQADGCIEINFTSITETSTAKIWTKFNYTYKDKPREFVIHISVFVENITGTAVKVSLVNDGKETFSESVTNLKTDQWAHQFIASGESPRLLSTAFPKSGEYTFEVQVTSNTNNTILIDNVDLLIYGEVFGLLGTDGNQDRPRDIFTTLIHGTRISLVVGLLSAIISTFLGLFIGLVAGYLRGAPDEFLMRFADFLMVLPTLPLLIVLIVTTSASFWNLILIISFMGWMTFSRQIRSMVLSLKERAFVEAAKACGASTSYIISRHMLPNVFALVYITLATSVPGAIIAEASISWLGLFDPTIVSWGRMLYEFTGSGVIIRPMSEYWFWVIPPGLAIMFLAIAFILIGYALDEILNPKLRRR